MKLYKYIFILCSSFLIAQKFDVSDPPMIYIYHFVSYDTASVVFHGGVPDESQNKLLKLPFSNVGNIVFDDNIVSSKPLNPKILSSMVTSAISKNRHVKIAGESIQNRLIKDDFLKIVRSYDYPKRTDFVFLGEINSIADQYEIDLKIIDVSLQKIIGSRSFNLPFNSIAELRPMIETVVDPLIEKILSPFLGYVFLSVDSTSRKKIRWDKISIRPYEVVINKKNQFTDESDFQSFYTTQIEDGFLKTHRKLLQNYKPWSIEKEVNDKIIAEHNGFDMPVSVLGEKAFKNISLNEKEKIIKTYILTDEEKENLVYPYDKFILKEVRKIWNPRYDDAYLIRSFNNDASFLQGRYVARVFLKNNETPFQINFSINPGDLNEILVTLPYIPDIKDSDGDGIIDQEDACPKIAGVLNDNPKKNGCPEPELERLFDLTINNFWSGVGIELIKVEDDFDEIIIKANKVNEKIKFNKKEYKISLNGNKKSLRVLNLPFGLYVLNAFAISTDPNFPGKHYISLFSESDTIDVYDFNQLMRFDISNRNKSLGKELVIYFDPFSKDNKEEYKIFVGESSIPSAAVTNSGEIHIVGFSPNYSGIIRVTRQNFAPAILKIEKGNKKSYHIAKLNRSDKKTNQDKKMKKLELGSKIKEIKSKNPEDINWFNNFIPSAIKKIKTLFIRS